MLGRAREASIAAGSRRGSSGEEPARGFFRLLGDDDDEG